MTAEGDNAVLMQKVSKELLTMLRAGQIQLRSEADKPASKELRNLEYLKYLIDFRFAIKIMELAANLQSKIGDGLDIFEIWMQQESDSVQAVARAYGEKVVVEAFWRQVEQSKPSIKPMLLLLFETFIIECLDRDLAWFLVQQMLSPEEGKATKVRLSELCKELAPQALNLVDAFGVPDHIVQAPIALDWEKFNVSDNRGESAGYVKQELALS